MPRPKPRTLPELIDHLEQQGRLIDAAIDDSKIRRAAVDRVLESARTGTPIEPCDLEDLNVDEWMDAS